MPKQSRLRSVLRGTFLVICSLTAFGGLVTALGTDDVEEVRPNLIAGLLGASGLLLAWIFRPKSAIRDEKSIDPAELRHALTVMMFAVVLPLVAYYTIVHAFHIEPENRDWLAGVLSFIGVVVLVKKTG